MKPKRLLTRKELSVELTNLIGVPVSTDTIRRSEKRWGIKPITVTRKIDFARRLISYDRCGRQFIRTEASRFTRRVFVYDLNQVLVALRKEGLIEGGEETA
jgi:hypothetical protein